MKDQNVFYFKEEITSYLSRRDRKFEIFNYGEGEFRIDFNGDEIYISDVDLAVCWKPEGACLNFEIYDYDSPRKMLDHFLFNLDLFLTDKNHFLKLATTPNDSKLYKYARKFFAVFGKEFGFITYPVSASGSVRDLSKKAE